MKLDYNILWVDDRIKERPFQKILGETKDFLSDQYFNCNIIETEDFNEFKEIFSKKKEFDIIITDYSLNEGTFGSQVIDFVRDSEHNFTEIFFYSANDNVKDIKLFSNNRITFFQLTGGDYKELESEIMEVINQTIKKFQNIVAMRGMIMNETSSLDVEIEDILSKIIEKGDQKIIEIIKNKFLKTNSDFANRITNCNVVSDLLYYIGANHRVRSIIRNIDNGEIKDILSDYTKQIIEVRNQFAHAVLDSETNTFKTRNGIVFNNEECTNIRKNINRHIKNLKDLKTLIS
ncbi:hypothetical protein GCM10022386_17070 [Flavobacterium cheonhonense]|uniref:Response regulator n=1 Tax=Flavobacterium cheonhonense TaxID=706185 RepID=A0ABP7TYL5_9FLAO|nr:hypothetical protein [Flavobacterium cheonhonense]